LQTPSETAQCREAFGSKVRIDSGESDHEFPCCLCVLDAHAKQPCSAGCLLGDSGAEILASALASNQVIHTLELVGKCKVIAHLSVGTEAATMQPDVINACMVQAMA